ncbi:MAG: hypothetical protein G3M78_04170 [Candidatus Nitrohelix vancouverensis]|uniref:Glycosyltransferase RgtA/B/C/D-like domain-containing protein n=1 Tax=Candidatus Nitrohelix vancouverensis TaxID=2705534 RepID=A0A7T0C565_9BACT|nr:MAG: hypothetical protein G3M78_04170 [Candidatus Nitrohelix vancouverensis]
MTQGARVDLAELVKWSALYAVLAGYYLSFSKYGFNIWDEGGFANGSLRTLNGEMAGRDFNPIGYTPGRYVFGEFLFRVFGVHLQSLRIGVALLTPAMVIALYAVGRRIMPPGFALVAALFLLSAPSMYYNRFFIFFTVLNLFCLIRCMEAMTRGRLLILAGVVLLSAYFKFEVAMYSTLIAGVALGLLLWKRRRESDAGPGFQKTWSIALHRPVFWVTVAGLAAALAALLYYVSSINLYEKGVRQLLESYEVWGNPMPALFPVGEVWATMKPHEYFDRVLFYIPPLLYALTGLLLAWRLLRREGGWRMQDYYLFVIFAFGLCSFGLVIWRSGHDNLLRTLAPAYLLFCYGLYLVWNRATKAPLFSGGGLLKRMPLNLLLLLAPFFYLYEMNVNHGFYAGSIGAMRQETTRLTLERMDVYTNEAEALMIENVLERIQIYSDKNDRIFALPLNPIFYFISERSNPTPYDWILPGMLDEGGERKVIEYLRKDSPKVIIYVDIPIDGKNERRFVKYSPQVFNYIAENYLFDEFVGYFQILLPRSILE